MDDFELYGEGELTKVFCQALEKGGEGVIAVAAWEKGASDYLDLTDGSGVQIVCNLDDPRCHPQEIEALIARKFRVWTNPRLQAALFATPTLAVVGSHNIFRPDASAPDKSRMQWIEGYVTTQDKPSIETVRGRLGEILNLSDTKRVTKRDLARAKVDRSRFSLALFSMPKGHSIFEAAREHPELFKSVYVAAYELDLDDEAQELLEKGSAGVAADLKLTRADRLWGYQIKGLASGDQLIDLSLVGSQPRVMGTAHVLSHSLKTKNGEELRFAIPSPINVGGLRYDLSSKEEAALARAARRILAKAKGGLIRLSDAVRIIDGS